MNDLNSILAGLKSQDNSALEEQRNRQRMMAGLAEAAEQMFTAGDNARSGRNFDGSFYGGLKQQVDQDFQAKLAQRQEMLRNRILGKQLVDADADRTRRVTLEDQDRAIAADDRQRKLDREQMVNDPNSRANVVMAGAIGKLSPGLDLSGLGGQELQSLIPLASAIRNAETEQQKIAAQNALTRAANAAKIAADNKKNEIDRSDKMFDQEKKVRQEYRDNPVVLAAEEGERGLAQLKSNLNQGTKAGDLAAIFNFMKTLDPRSVVRENEQISVQRTDGIFGVMQRYASMFNAEGSLTPAARKELAAAMEAQVDVAKSTLPEVQQRYFDPIIKQYGLSSDNVYGRSSQGASQNKEDKGVDNAFSKIQLDASSQGDVGKNNAFQELTPEKVAAFAKANGIDESQARRILERRLQK